MPPRAPPEPADIDVVTFVRIPEGVDPNAHVQPLLAQRQLFNPRAKKTFSCDAYFGTVTDDNHVDLQFSTYWYGLFSHRRTDFQWKGLLQVDLQSDDVAAAVALQEIKVSLIRPHL